MPSASRVPRKKPSVEDRIAAVKSLHDDDRSNLLRSVSYYLNDRSPKVRETALQVALDQALSELDDQVRALVFDRNSFVRQRAIECFGLFHEGEAIKAPWLYPFLKDPNTLTRVETLETLDQIGDKSALPAMAEKLRDDDYLVRAYAAICIAQLGGRRFRKRIESASKIEEAEKAKPWFARALLFLGDWKQFSNLLELLSSNSPTTRCAAANALAAFDWSSDQLRLVLSAVADAERNFLARSDQTTMQRVLKELLEGVAAPKA
jgi:serine/threonine-protein kinase